MSENDELRQAREMYEFARSESTTRVIDGVADALITALEKALDIYIEREGHYNSRLDAKDKTLEAQNAAQQQRIALLEPFAALWQRWLDSSAYDGETPGAFTEWLYDESVFRVAHDFERAYKALHTDGEE